MKKVLTLLLFIGSGLSYGEELKFVTYLSSPVGTFSQLETADPAASLVMTGDSQEVNFCNTRVNTGSINIRSAAGAVLNRLNLSNGTSLKGSVPDYRLSNSLTLNRGGSLTAKQILGTTAAYESSSMHKSKVNNTLYITNAGTVKGAKTESLTIRDKATTGTNGTGTTGVELWWDNQYTRDYTSAGVATGSKTYDSYLLKSRIVCNAAEESSCKSSNGSWNSDFCECTCPSGTVLINQKCIVKFSPKIITAGVLVNCSFCPSYYRKRCGAGVSSSDDCYTGGDFDNSKGCDHACTKLMVNSYEYFDGGSLTHEPKSGKVSARWLYWSGGTRIGGRLVLYSGKSMPVCSSDDYQALCDSNCSKVSSSCSFRCLISQTDSGCSNGYYTYSGGTCGKASNNASGTAQILTCVK